MQVARPSTWNSLSHSLPDPALNLSTFRPSPKNTLFCEKLTERTQRIRDFLMRMRYINLHFAYTYLLTYLLTYFS